MLEDLARSMGLPQADMEDITRLTPREWEVLQALGEGKVVKAIAEEMVLAPETVRWYLKEIYSKLDAHSMVEAAAKGRRLGMIR